MTKGVVTCNLYKRKGRPSVNAERLGYFVSGDEIEIEDVVLGETEADYYEGTPTWYKLTNGIFVWSGGVSMNLDAEVFGRKIELDRSSVKSSLSPLDVYNPDNFWWIKEYGINKIWDRGLSGKGVRIAILDSGLSLPHLDIVYDLSYAKDFSNSSSGIDDKKGHGTHVMGIIAATKNGFGITGIAHSAEIYFAKVRNDITGFHMTYLIKAIEWAIEMQVDIISISYGEREEYPGLLEVIKKAFDSNILVVCAAGNKTSVSGSKLFYPARFPETLSVGGCRIDRQMLPTTIAPESTDLFAPGENIKSTYLNSRYESMSGSSQAAPFVAGLAALLLQEKRKLNPMLKATKLKEILISNADTVNYGKIVNPMKSF